MNNSDIIEKFLSIKIKNDSTKRQYYDEIESFICFLKGKNLLEVSKEDVQEYIEYLLTIKIVKAGKKAYEEEKNYANSTIIKKLRVLQSLYKQLQLDKLVDENPFFKVTMPLQKSGSVRTERLLTSDEKKSLFAAALKSSSRDYAIIELMYYAKMSPQEICAFNWGDILTGYNGIVVTSRGNVRRTIALPPDVKKFIMEDYRESIGREPLSEPFTIPTEEVSQPVFTNKIGRRISTSATIRNMVYKLCKIANIDKIISPLDLGHSGAVTAKLYGATDEQIKNHGNFSSIQVGKKYDTDKLLNPACNLIPKV